MNSCSVFAWTRGVDHDHEVGVVDRRDRREIAHQLVFALRHQRLIGGLGVRHHQQRVAVGRRLGGLDRADDAAGAGAVLDHEGLAKTLLQDAADLAGGDIGRAAGAERDDHPDRPGGIVLRQTWRRKNGLCREKRCRQRKRRSQAHHFNLPKPVLFCLACCRPNLAFGAKSSDPRDDRQYPQMRHSSRGSTCIGQLDP